MEGFSAINITKSIGNSTFHSLQAKVERRIANGSSALGSYTFSKTLSNADTSTVGAGSFLDGIQNYFDLAAERSPATFDVRHRLSVAAIYDLPSFTRLGNSVARMMLGGGR